MKDEIKKIWEKCGYDEDTKLYGEDAFNFLKDNNIESVEARYEDTSDYSEGYRVSSSRENDSSEMYSMGAYFNCRLDEVRSDEGSLVFCEEQAYIGSPCGEWFDHIDMSPTLVVDKEGYKGYLTISKHTYDNAWRVIHYLENSTDNLWKDDPWVYAIEATHLPTGRKFLYTNYQEGLANRMKLMDLLKDLKGLREGEDFWECEESSFFGELGDNVFNDCIFKVVKLED